MTWLGIFVCLCMPWLLACVNLVSPEALTRSEREREAAKYTNRGSAASGVVCGLLFVPGMILMQPDHWDTGYTLCSLALFFAIFPLCVAGGMQLVHDGEIRARQQDRWNSQAMQAMQQYMQKPMVLQPPATAEAHAAQQPPTTVRA